MQIAIDKYGIHWSDSSQVQNTKVGMKLSNRAHVHRCKAEMKTKINFYGGLWGIAYCNEILTITSLN